MGLFYKGRLIALTLFFSLFFSVLYAQEAYISGTITDKQTGETLIGANVVIQGTTMGVSTDIDGKYVLAGVPEGDYTLWITYIGYEEALIPISLKAGDKKVIDASLGYGGAVGLDEVVVTAQAKGQMSAINQQLNSKSIANVVSAEKMQELPDANAAETLGRLPGVSVARTGGEGNKVVVRGLSPKYNRVTMEGVNMASAGDDRSTDISSISPYSLGGITVYKAATADKNAEFIGGMIEFKLREAREGWNSDVVAQMGYNELKGTFTDYLVNASVSNRFLDNKLGVFLQGNVEQRNRSSNEMNATYRMNDQSVIGGNNNKLITQNASLQDVFRSKNRIGATAVLDYRLEDGSIKFKNFYSGGDTKIQKYGDYVQSDPTANQTITRTGQDVQYLSTSYSNILSFDKRFNKLKIEGKVSHSYSKSETPYQTDAKYLQNTDVFDNTDFLTGEVKPSEILDKAKYNEDITYLQTMTQRSQVIEDRQIGASFDITYDYKINTKFSGFIKLGTDYRATDRTKDITVWGSDLTQARNTVQLWDHYYPGEGKSGQYPFSNASNPNFDHRTFMDGRYKMGSVVDMDMMNDMMDVIRSNGDNLDQYPYTKSSNLYDYSGNEEYFAAYVLTELNIGSKIKFIPGMRYESNNTNYTGTYGNTSGAYPELAYPSMDTTTVRDNWYLLPMIHLKYKPTEWFDVRVAYTHTLSRPSFHQIAPRMDYYQNAKIVSFNNYSLIPEYSVNWDIYMSFHSNKLGLFTIGGFTKKIDNMIFDTGRRSVLSDNDYDLPTGPVLGYPDTYVGQVIYTTVNSKDEADLYGVEIDWQSNFFFLPGAWKGIVMNINYTHIYSEAKYPTSSVEQITPPSGGNASIQTDSFYYGSLVDQPEDIFNLGLGYDYKGFSARVSMFYQTSVFKKPNQFIELTTYNEDYMRWDFTAKQKLPIAGLELFVNINNITNSKDITVVNGTGYDSNISGYGMTADIGVRWRL